ncbi:hypothetical protein G6F50_015529 [Rhizopus delemar]|uniref:Uncharacterized protein n=1 Tax=Rhizopus delemar TaxID=936053 RepID=A0A9P6XX98_9FUNG|nr:hypothetical protein G6F50_015529 [Rhizopus delemar]
MERIARDPACAHPEADSASDGRDALADAGSRPAWRKRVRLPDEDRFGRNPGSRDTPGHGRLAVLPQRAGIAGACGYGLRLAFPRCRRRIRKGHDAGQRRGAVASDHAASVRSPGVAGQGLSDQDGQPDAQYFGRYCQDACLHALPASACQEQGRGRIRGVAAWRDLGMA